MYGSKNRGVINSLTLVLTPQHPSFNYINLNRDVLDMSRTYRCWSKSKEHWKQSSMLVFGYYKKRRIRKEIRRSIRCTNRTLFSHIIYEPILEVKDEYFD